jgi:hypothetical protein
MYRTDAGPSVCRSRTPRGATPEAKMRCQPPGGRQFRLLTQAAFEHLTWQSATCVARQDTSVVDLKFLPLLQQAP